MTDIDPYVWAAAGAPIRAGRGISLGAPGDPPPPSGDALTWAPPNTAGYTTQAVPTSGGLISLNNNTDYVLTMPTNAPVTAPLLIRGGRNIVMIGGEVKIDNITYASNGADEANQNGIRFQDNTSGMTAGRIVHVEGILIHGYGLSDGIRTANNGSTATQSPDLRVQNCRIEVGMWYRDSALDGSGTPHPDIIQPYGGVGWLRMDKVTGLYTGQGLMLKPDYGSPNPGFMQLKRLNLRENTNPNIEYNDPNATYPRPSGRNPRYLWWGRPDGGEGGIRLHPGTVWFHHPYRSFTSGMHIFWPEPNRATSVGTDATGTYTEPANAPGWDGTGQGRVYQGNPPGGDFCPVGVAGRSYVSPGYL